MVEHLVCNEEIRVRFTVGPYNSKNHKFKNHKSYSNFHLKFRDELKHPQ